MLSTIVRRLGYGVLILIGVNLATFFLFFTVNTPDDMARLNIGGKRVTQEQIVKWKAERGYDKPLYVNDAREGSERYTDTIFWDRSVSLFTLNFGRSDSESAGDIGYQVRERMAVSLQLALPLFLLQVIASTAFALLLAGEVVVGVGNIYASEALFQAGIRPTTRAARLSRPRLARLHHAVRDVLTRAVAKGGSTLRDFSNTQGESGYFQLEAMVYGRAAQPCKVCATPIRSIRQGQRATFFCPLCQKA